MNLRNKNNKSSFLPSWINIRTRITIYEKSGSIWNTPKIIPKRVRKPILSVTVTTNGQNKNKVKKLPAHSLIPQYQTSLSPNANKDPLLSITTPSQSKIWMTGSLNPWTGTSPACSTHIRSFTFHKNLKKTSSIATETGLMFWKAKKTFIFHPARTREKNLTPRTVNSK